MFMPLLLHPRSRSRAAVARRAHNPKVGGSIPPFATNKASLKRSFFIMRFKEITRLTPGIYLMFFVVQLTVKRTT